MTYKKYSPSAGLSAFVNCFFIWESEDAEKLLVQSPPSGFTGMVFNYADPYRAFQAKNQPEDVPLSFASGQFTVNYHLDINGKIGLFGVVLQASSLYNLFGADMPSLVNRRLELPQLVGKTADEVLLSVRDSTGDEEKIKVVEDFLTKYINNAQSRQSIIDEAIQYIDRSNGMVTIEEVLTKFRCSRRYIEKKFREKIGISPKLYARIKRFSYLSAVVANNKDIDWQDIVFENGFHDQSHLAKDYRTFNQMNPSEYHQKHRELIRYLGK